MMSHGNPYGTDSFPRREAITRAMLALTNGAYCAFSFSWGGGHTETAVEVMRAVLPMLGVQFFGVLLITYVPPLTTWLPHLLAK